jgi:hypothetical protein
MCCALPGLTTGYGPSHQATEDLALLRGIPGLTIIDPCDGADGTAGREPRSDSGSGGNGIPQVSYEPLVGRPALQGAHVGAGNPFEVHLAAFDRRND